MVGHYFDCDETERVGHRKRDVASVTPSERMVTGRLVAALAGSFHRTELVQVRSYIAGQ